MADAPALAAPSTLTDAGRVICWTNLLARVPTDHRLDALGRRDLAGTLDDDAVDAVTIQSDDLATTITADTVQRYLVVQRDGDLYYLSTTTREDLPSEILRLSDEEGWTVDTVYDLLTDRPVRYALQVVVDFGDDQTDAPIGG